LQLNVVTDPVVITISGVVPGTESSPEFSPVPVPQAVTMHIKRKKKFLML
jgi:hypothetical protein